MNVNRAILSYIENHPGTGSKRVFSYINTLTKDSKIGVADVKESFIYKKLRVLRNEGKLHNIGSSWYPINKLKKKS